MFYVVQIMLMWELHANLYSWGEHDGIIVTVF